MRIPLRSLLFSLSLFSFAVSILQAQSNQWAWMKGDSTINQNNTIGTAMGISSPLNWPSGRYEAVQWTDLNGNFWLYGGNSMNDLWKYNPATNQWAWMQGSGISGTAAAYGTQGVPSVTNNPGGRTTGSCSWTDLNGNLWLYGGAAPAGGCYNDLWEYNIASNQWTWMQGSNLTAQPAVYGTQGVAAAANTPGKRMEAAANWVDNSGNLWVYGGFDGSANWYADLWMYNIASNMWTWVSGDNTFNTASVFGTQSIANPANKPGARWVYSGFKDLGGNLWMFGGCKNGGGYWNDMWKYNISTNQWAWMSGSNTTGATSVYGVQCAESPGNVPCSRVETRSSWTDQCGYFWVFGGFSTTAGTGWDNLNDLWRYDPYNNQWKWVSGGTVSNAKGIYGSQTVPAPANMPGGRNGSISWINKTGLWLWGGNGYGDRNATMADYGYLSDLWLFQVDKPQAHFTVGPIPSCSAFPALIEFTDSSISGCSGGIKSRVWNFGDPASGTSDTSTALNPSHTYSTAETFTVKLIVSNCFGALDSVSKTLAMNSGGISLTTSSSPATCNTANGSASVSVTGGASPYSFLWSNGPTSATQNNLLSANYTVTVSDTHGCSASTTIQVKNSGGPSIGSASVKNSICLPSAGSITATASGGSGSLTFSWSNGASGLTATGLNAGFYTLTATDANGCNDTVSFHVLSKPGPTLTIQNAANTCAGQKQGAITTRSTGSGTLSYSWSDGIQSGASSGTAGSNNISSLAPGSYTITVTDPNGCTATTDTTITQFPLPTISASPDTTVTSGSSVKLIAKASPGVLSYSWSPSSSLSSQNSSNPTASPSTSTIYTITVSDNNNCTATTTDTLIVIFRHSIPCDTSILAGSVYLPSAFSPNGDGENDILFLRIADAHCLTSIYLSIFDRWGELVFQTSNLEPQTLNRLGGWDGTFRGARLGQGVFFYYLKLQTSTGIAVTRKGNITLLR